jgi:tetratricopeptide (TPR) repeat protein
MIWDTWVRVWIRVANHFWSLGVESIEAGRPLRGQRFLEVASVLFRWLGAGLRDPRGVQGSLLVELGDALFDQNRLPAAADAYNRSLETRRARLLAEPRSPQAKDDLSLILERVAKLRRVEGDLAGARELTEEALLLRRQIVQAEPHNAHYRHLVGASLNTLADIAREQTDLDRASALIEEGLDLWTDLAADYPETEPYERFLGDALRSQGQIRADRHDPAGAREAFENCIYIRRNRAALRPGDSLTHMDLCDALRLLADTQISLDNEMIGRANLREALSLSLDVAVRFPRLARAQRNAWLTMWSMAHYFPGEPVRWKDVADYMEALDQRGLLLAGDRELLDDAREYASGPQPVDRAILRAIAAGTLNDGLSAPVEAKVKS